MIKTIELQIITSPLGSISIEVVGRYCQRASSCERAFFPWFISDLLIGQDLVTRHTWVGGQLPAVSNILPVSDHVSNIALLPITEWIEEEPFEGRNSDLYNMQTYVVEEYYRSSQDSKRCITYTSLVFRS